MHAAALLAVIAAPSAFAANGTWSNAPVSSSWTNVLNWNGGIVPGTINNTGNNGTDSASIAFFTNAIATFGGAANPVIPDDGTITNGKARMIGRVAFEGASCGAYVFNSPSPFAAQTGSTPETGVLSLCVPGVGGNGTNGTYIAAGVTNPQTFLVPVQIRLPSSTTGVYGFTNNATSSAATFYFARLFLYPAATGRGVTYIFEGSNTGTNTVALLQQSANQTGSPTGLRKSGTGRWILSGANSFNGGSGINIDQGTLEVLDPAAFGAVTTSASVNNNGVLQINGVTLNVLSLGLKNSGTVRMNGTATLNGVAVNTGVGNTPIITTTSASDVFTVGSGLVASSIVSGGAADSVLNTAGPGSIILGQSGAFANTYVGRWSFSAKTNVINSTTALGTGPNANVGAGAIFDFSILGAGSYVPTTAGFGGSGTGSTIGSTAAAVVGDAGGTLDLSSKAINLTFTPTGFAGDTTHPSLVIAQGTLAIGGNTFFINNAGGTALGFGTYRLITQASGSVTSGGGYAALISGSGAVGGSTVSIVVTGGNVDLVVAPYVPKNLVWSGTGANWDVATTSDWLNGVTASIFNNSDNVTFNGTGLANPSVNLVGTLAPASVVVDTASGGYTFTGAGQIAGTTSLVKKSVGTLTLNTVNTYAGGTVVSNGTVKIGANNAISSTGSGNVAAYGAGVVDLNGFNNTVNALVGNGIVDNTSGGASILTVGGNDNSGTFSGVIQNTSGTLGLTKIGTGAETLTSSNSYSGPTSVTAGTLTVANQNALGIGDLTVIAGTVNLQTGVTLNSLAGSAGGIIANNANASTNGIRITGSTTTTFGGNVIDGSGGGGVSLTLLGGTLFMSGNNTYSGGTYVGSGATFNIPNSPAAVGGFLIASNGATVGLTGGSGTPGTPNSVTTVDGATATFTGGAEGKLWGCQWNGGVNSTNFYTGPCSFNQPLSFSNFLGRVRLSTTTQNFRFNNALSGGDNTIFEFVLGNVHINGAQTVRLGEMVGGSQFSGITGGAGAGLWIIGTKNTSSTFQGYISGSGGGAVSLVKSGTGSLTLNGLTYYTNTVTLPDPFAPTNIVSFTLISNATMLTYTGNTTVSNGTLAIVGPNNLSNSPSITLAGGTLDVSQIGYVTDQTIVDYNSVVQPTNSVITTTGILDVFSGQSLNGNGNITGGVNAQAGSTVNPGLSVGTMAVSGAVSLNGTVNMNLNRTNAPNNSDRITAASFSGSGATLNVTDAGPALFTGTVCQLFSGPVSAFTTVNLPASNGATTYVWTNKIAINGTIELLSGASPVNPNPTNITATVTGGGTTLTLSWPSGHTGWVLQAQTNSINVGISGTWVDVVGSAATNQVIVPINPANPTVFYRLKL